MKSTKTRSRTSKPLDLGIPMVSVVRPDAPVTTIADMLEDPTLIPPEVTEALGLEPPEASEARAAMEAAMLEDNAKQRR